VWWSLYGLALPALPPAQALLALASPAFISYLILKVKRPRCLGRDALVGRSER
jgi:hypothetical protein